MSYYTNIEIVFWDNSLPSEDFADQVIAWAKEDHVNWEPSSGVDDMDIDSLTDALTGKMTLFHGYQDKFDEMFTRISGHFHGVVFGVRGWGEDFEDAWLGYFKNGVRHETRPPKG